MYRCYEQATETQRHRGNFGKYQSRSAVRAFGKVFSVSLCLCGPYVISYTPYLSGSHCSPNSVGGAMYPANADAATTDGEAR
jgi:hypothetical protein